MSTPQHRPVQVPGPAGPPRLTFGIFPGMTGAEGASNACAATTYDVSRTDEALAILQPPSRPFVVRSYAIYKGQGRVELRTPPDVAPYLHGGRTLDSVLCYRPEVADMDDWTRFVREAVQQVGDRPAAIQVAEEPNNPRPDTGGDGSSPDVIRAVVEGVLAAKDEVTRLGVPARVGFNACPSADDRFWTGLAAIGGRAFAEAVDYVGSDFFPDVFRPIPFEGLRAAVEGVLTGFRTVSLAACGIPTGVPIRVVENGWPTGPGRPPERQSAVLETVVRTIDDLRGPLNITHYEFFSLRDPGGDGEGFREFGLIRDDYSPKPAFETYRRLIAELGAEG